MEPWIYKYYTDLLQIAEYTGVHFTSKEIGIDGLTLRIFFNNSIISRGVMKGKLRTFYITPEQQKRLKRRLENV